MHASFASPLIVASNISQFKDGGTLIIKTKIIKSVKTALKLFVLICLFNKSKFLIPEYSILIKYNPRLPKINGRKKFNVSGKKDVIFILNDDFKITSKIPTKIKKVPINR